MCENQFITLNQERRKDINSIIHSNRFDFLKIIKDLCIFTKRARRVNIIQLLVIPKKIFKEEIV